MNDAQRIERRIEIHAAPKRVWDLICEPGWWINDGTIEAHPVEHDGDLATVRHPKHGTFHVRTVNLDPPRHAAFRWVTPATGGGTHEEHTLVEFWIEETAPDSVTLRVVESGFESLDVSEQERRKKIDENAEGWEIELAAARTFVMTS